MDHYLIHKTMSEYCQFIDDGRLDELSQLYAANGVLNIAAYQIRAEGRAAVRAQYGKMIDPAMKGTHCIFNPVIDITGTTASATFDFTWIDTSAAPIIGNVGRYTPRLIKESDRWRFLELNVEIRSKPVALAK